jgi:hypothetical protein
MAPPTRAGVRNDPGLLRKNFARRPAFRLSRPSRTCARSRSGPSAPRPPGWNGMAPMTGAPPTAVERRGDRERIAPHDEAPVALAAHVVASGSRKSLALGSRCLGRRGEGGGAEETCSPDGTAVSAVSVGGRIDEDVVPSMTFWVVATALLKQSPSPACLAGRSSTGLVHGMTVMYPRPPDRCSGRRHRRRR